MLERRFDNGTLRALARTDEGYLLAEGYASRPGVLEYRRADGSIRRELVLAEELARVDSLETLARKPVTLQHPDDEFVTPENIADHEVGDVAETIEIERVNGFVKIRMAIRRADAIKAVDDGVRQLSAGYTVEIENTSGTHPEFGRYDAIQRNRKYNHVAIVQFGRAGDSVGLRADSAASITPFEEPKKMTIETEAPVAKNDDLKADNDKLQAQVDALKAELEKLKTAKTESEKKDERMAWYAEREDALTVARIAKIDGAEKLDLADLKRAVVAKHLGDKMRADASEDYIDAAFDFAKESVEKTKQAQTYNPENAEKPRTDSVEISAEQAFRDNLTKQLKRG